MPYRFAVQRENYADYSSGRVFYNLPGHPAFPVRLASEIFQRCLQIRSAKGLNAPARLYDPCCGGAYHLAVLGYLHGERIMEMRASDIDPQALAVAQRNLTLLTLAGLGQRIAEIEEMQRLYGKPSHLEAWHSAGVLRRRLEELIAARPIAFRTFQADALERQAIRDHLGDYQPDLIISDVPYGIQTAWQGPGAEGGKAPVELLLGNLRDILAPAALVVIASAKDRRITGEGYKQIGKIKAGKRQAVILERE